MYTKPDLGSHFHNDNIGSKGCELPNPPPPFLQEWSWGGGHVAGNVGQDTEI